MLFAKTLFALFKSQIKAHTGQFGEDIIIKKLFAPKKKNGFYVDLGANHPFLHSNTAWFWLNGWSGINIDANLKSISIFNKIRKKDTNLNYAIISSDQYRSGIRNINLYLPDEPTGPGGITATASVNQKIASDRKFSKKQSYKMASKSHLSGRQMIPRSFPSHLRSFRGHAGTQKSPNHQK